MKKLFAILIALAMLVSMFALNVGVAYAEEHTVWSYEGTPNNDDPWNLVLSLGYTFDFDATVRFETNFSFKRIIMPRYWAAGNQTITVEFFSGTEKKAETSFVTEPDKADLTELDLGTTLPAGAYSMKITNTGSEHLFLGGAAGLLGGGRFESRGNLAFGLVTDDAGGEFLPLSEFKIEYPDPESGIPGNQSLWLSTETSGRGEYCESVAAVINVNAPVKQIGVPNFWISNTANGSGQVGSKMEVSVYSFVDDYATSIAGTPLAKAVEEVEGDENKVNGAFTASGTGWKLTKFNNGSTGFAIEFDTPLPAGQYVFVVKSVCQAEGHHYIVLPMSEKTDAYSNPKAKYYVDDDEYEYMTFKVGVVFDNYGKLVNLASGQSGQSGQTPVNPPSADASMVIFVVAAAAIALVVLKKKVF